MARYNKELSCRNIGLIVKDYAFISNSILNRHIGADSHGDDDLWGLKAGAIADPYYAEDFSPLWARNYYKATTNNYMEFIRSVFDSAPSFDNQYNLVGSEFSINESTVDTYKMGNSLSSILNGIQSFVTADKNNGYGSFMSKLYSMHNTSSEIGVIRNYNMNEPKINTSDGPDTLLANLGLVYRGKLFMDGMLRWGADGVFGNYSPISSRMSRYFFTEGNYGYGLDQNFGNGQMSQLWESHIDGIISPIDVKPANGIFAPNQFGAYGQYYNDLGWRSKYYWSNSMSFNVEGKEVQPYDLNIGSGMSWNYNSDVEIRVYPEIRAKNNKEMSTSVAVIYNRYKKNYNESDVRFRDFSMTPHLVNERTQMQYAEKDTSHDATVEKFNFNDRYNHLSDYTDEDYDARLVDVNAKSEFVRTGDFGGLASQGELGRTPITIENGQANGNFRPYFTTDSLEYNDLISLTNEAFIKGTYESLVARFHTSSDDGKTRQDTQTAVSEQFGLSHGRNLLKAGVNAGNPTYSNGYSNPYCRVWTYHHQYHTLQNALRGGGTWGQEFASELSQNAPYYPFRAFGTRPGFVNGQDSLNELSVLNHANNIVNITPKTDSKEFDVKRCMFSIENLAWRDKAIVSPMENGGYFSTLKHNQIGPLGGRIMWFPPYDVRISEIATAGWQDAGKFIGRSEPIKVWTGGERTGTLTFKMIVDHPSILNYIDSQNKRMKDDTVIGSIEEDVDDTGSTEQTILRFFAGCDYLTPRKPEIKKTKIYKRRTEKKIPSVKQRRIRFCVFYPNNYSGADLENRAKKEYNVSENSSIGAKDALCYLANGVGTQLYLDIDEVNVENRDLHSIKPSWLDVTLETKWKVINPDFEKGALLKSFNYDDGAYYAQKTLVPKDDKDGFTSKYSVKPERASEYSRDEYPLRQDVDYSDSLVGYEMRINDKPGQGSSRVNNENWRYFYPLRDGDDAMLSSHTTPVFLAVKKDDDNRVYYMPTINGTRSWGQYVKDKNEWLYQVDYSSYSYPQTDPRSKTIGRGYHYKEKLTDHRDYADTESFGLNGIQGLSTVANMIFNGYYSSDESGSGCTMYTSEDGQLISFADFMVACYMLEKGSPNTNGLALQEGVDYCMDNVNVIYSILKEGKGSISISGTSNIHGVSNGTSDKEKEETEDDANGMLALHRGQVISSYLKSLQSNKKIGDFYFNEVQKKSHNITGDEREDVNQMNAKLWRNAIVDIEWTLVEDDSKAVYEYEEQTYRKNADGSETILSTTRSRGGQSQVSMGTDNALVWKTQGDNTWVAETEEEVELTEAESMEDTRYEDEYGFFKTIDAKSPFLRNKIREKIQYFDPVYHSLSPEGFNARLTFIHQCTKQGPTFDSSNSNNASNLSFGRPPVCVLRLGDFWYSKVLIDNVQINYDDTTWDINPEGIGVQPMVASITLGLTFIGGQDLGGPVPRLQNATSFNYYANTRVYDDRAEQIKYNKDNPSPYEFEFVPNQYQD